MEMNGHYHPTEVVSDKIPALLCFFPEIALHITRPIRWDSDHVVLFDDETKEIAKEIVRCDGLDRTYMALDYFDASINRISAWTVGFRSWQKALLSALITPNDMLRKLQEEGNMTRLMVMQEEMKTLPFGDIWEKYCEECGVAADESWLDDVLAYEKKILAVRKQEDIHMRFLMQNSYRDLSVWQMTDGNKDGMKEMVETIVSFGVL